MEIWHYQIKLLCILQSNTDLTLSDKTIVYLCTFKYRFDTTSRVNCRKVVFMKIF